MKKRIALIPNLTYLCLVAFSLAFTSCGEKDVKSNDPAPIKEIRIVTKAVNAGTDATMGGRLYYGVIGSGLFSSVIEQNEQKSHIYPFGTKPGQILEIELTFLGVKKPLRIQDNSSIKVEFFADGNQIRSLILDKNTITYGSLETISVIERITL